MSSFSSTPNFDNLLLQTLMGRLQIRPPSLHSTPTPPPPPQFLNQTLEDLLLDINNNLSDDDDDGGEEGGDAKTQLAREESKLEKEIIRTILAGKSETLKPNSGQAVTIGEHHICVGFHEETGSDYRVWEWHGHIMMFDDENGYNSEYIYGNYFERLPAGAAAAVAAKSVAAVKKDDDDDDEKEDEEKEEEEICNLGLKELIEPGVSGIGRILHRNINAGSPRF